MRKRGNGWIKVAMLQGSAGVEGVKRARKRKATEGEEEEGVKGELWFVGYRESWDKLKWGETQRVSPERLGVQWRKMAQVEACQQGEQGGIRERGELDPVVARVVREVMGNTVGGGDGPSAEECMILGGVELRATNLKRAACVGAKKKATYIGTAGQKALCSMKNSYKQEIWMQEERTIGHEPEKKPLFKPNTIRVKGRDRTRGVMMLKPSPIEAETDEAAEAKKVCGITLLKPAPTKARLAGLDLRVNLGMDKPRSKAVVRELGHMAAWQVVQQLRDPEVEDLTEKEECQVCNWRGRVEKATVTWEGVGLCKQCYKATPSKARQKELLGLVWMIKMGAKLMTLGEAMDRCLNRPAVAAWREWRWDRQHDEGGTESWWKRGVQRLMQPENVEETEWEDQWVDLDPELREALKQYQEHPVREVTKWQMGQCAAEVRSWGPRLNMEKEMEEVEKEKAEEARASARREALVSKRREREELKRVRREKAQATKRDQAEKEKAAARSRKSAIEAKRAAREAAAEAQRKKREEHQAVRWRARQEREKAEIGKRNKRNEMQVNRSQVRQEGTLARQWSRGQGWLRKTSRAGEARGLQWLRGLADEICIAELTDKVTRNMVEQALWKGALVWAEEGEGGHPTGRAGTQPALGLEPAVSTSGPHRAEPPRLARPGGERCRTRPQEGRVCTHPRQGVG